nr:putative reverse transcriptase domain-containing protein [Tanacetum cinerariifolium]
MKEGNGPKWLFDIDSLTQSINYVPVVAGTIPDESTGIKGDLNVGTSSGKEATSQDYIMMPIWKDASYFDSPSKDVEDGPHNDDDEKDKFEDDIRASDTLEATHVEFFSDKDAPEVDLGNIPLLWTLSDSSWVEAMQEELLQFKLQQVWILIDFPYGKKTIGTKWVFKNRKDKRGIVIRNKASAFLYGTIEEKVYVTQPPGFKDLDHPDKVYKVVKALYGLHQAPKACQDKYVNEILKKFTYSDVKSVSTPVDLEKPLVKDVDANDVDVHLYRSMIGSLMYLTASRPDIIDSLFELVAYTDSDYVGATQDRKSITRGCQFLGNRLISRQCKKQTVVATSTTEAEYVVAAS